jgi:hypothetical protein
MLPWTDLRSIGNSTAARLTILIPLVGYLIIFNESLLQYVELSRNLFGHEERSTSGAYVSPRLLCIYFGLCLIAAGSVLFGWFCPQEVKKYGSSAELVGGDGKDMSFGELVSIANLLRGTRWFSKDFDNFCEAFNARHLIKGLDDHRENNKEVEALGLDNYFQFLNFRNPAIRAATAAFYGAGFLVLSVPSIEVFARVTSALWRSLYR